jgi:hypothetical protein
MHRLKPVLGSQKRAGTMFWVGNENGIMKCRKPFVCGFRPFFCLWNVQKEDLPVKNLKRIALLSLCLCMILSAASAATFTDAHGNVIELDETLEAYAAFPLFGAENAARKGETNLGDLWADALRWFAVSGEINNAFEEDDVTAGITSLDVDADHVVALWNGGNLRADIPKENSTRNPGPGAALPQ